MIKINVRAAKPVLAVSGRHEVRGEHGEPIGHRGSHRNGAATDSPDGLPQQQRRTERPERVTPAKLQRERVDGFCSNLFESGGNFGARLFFAERC